MKLPLGVSNDMIVSLYPSVYGGEMVVGDDAAHRDVSRAVDERARLEVDAGAEQVRSQAGATTRTTTRATMPHPAGTAHRVLSRPGSASSEPKASAIAHGDHGASASPRCRRWGGARTRWRTRRGSPRPCSMCRRGRCSLPVPCPRPKPAAPRPETSPERQRRRKDRREGQRQLRQDHPFVGDPEIPDEPEEQQRDLIDGEATGKSA